MPAAEVAGIPKLEAKLVGVFGTSNGPCKQGAEGEAMVQVAQIIVKNPQNLPLSIDRIYYTVNNKYDMKPTGSIPSEVKANDAVILELPLPESVKPDIPFGSDIKSADLQISVGMFVRSPDSKDVCKIDLVV